MVTEHVRWQVMPAHTPLLARHCAHCDLKRPFHCHERFRINGQKRKLDIWLIYKCAHCGTVWNMEIATRLGPEDIPSAKLRAMKANDGNLAWQYAFDDPTLKRSGADIPYPTDYDVLGPIIDWQWEGGVLFLDLEFPFSFDLRLGRLLQQQLGLSRSQVHRLAAEGSMMSTPRLDITRHKVREPLLQITINRRAVRAARRT